ncbi:hypothetical protein [Neptunitalea lumnitzerae]|uniref:Haem-binding uptake Tiki superfamily ChaN domain-containing protein n=1 Tax=Neptunitalea lumnitzerae TaxID=2965509 RepID=A0ABQ5MJ27_9FLAO|nr:hypothetical protein [Neptunitalea sp. Y10]GLB49394.1 hypothetical protein Y10_17620 [Neptunitalea sp. Y10]
MRIIKILGKILLVLLLLNLFIIAFFWIKNENYLESPNQKNLSYLKNNKKVILENRDRLNGFFDQEFYDSDVFLLGENHGFAEVQNIDFELLKHLNQKIGLKYYIAEMDSIRSKKLNQYLTDSIKNNSILRSVVIDIKQRIPQQSSQQLLEKWEKIYDYNKTLPDSSKITVLGIDKNFDDDSRELSRDSMMTLNLKSIINKRHLENEKFYGLFGYSHVLQESYSESNFRPFAVRIKSFIKKNKIKSLVCYNIDSEVYLPENDQFPAPEDHKLTILNEDGPIMLVKGINDLREITQPNSVTIFDLDNTNSPYRENQYLGGIKVNFFGPDVITKSSDVSTTDVLQYVFLIRNSKALEPIQTIDNLVGGHE